MCGHKKYINDAVLRAHAYPDIGPTTHAVHEQSLRIVVFTDASFANNTDFSSQIGSIIFLCDGTSRAKFRHYTSYKSTSGVRSGLSWELYALYDA